MRRLLIFAAAAALVLGSAGGAAAAGGSGSDTVKTYYLSLGDSLAAGEQPIGDPADGFRTDDGYGDQLFQMMRADHPKLFHKKLGCTGGETTTTMTEGGICEYGHGSQLAEALAFLADERNSVAFITIQIGANDFNCVGGYCVDQGVASITANLPVIVRTLRAAVGDDVPIIGMGLHNPLLATWLTGPDGQLLARYTETQMFEPVNDMFEAIYEGAGATYADIEVEFSSSDFDTLVELPGMGMVPINVAKICMWSWACAPAPLGPNNHPNTDGYAAMARAFAQALGH